MKRVPVKREEWTVIRLGDVCSKIGSGATPRGGSGVYLDSGEVALIRSQNVYNDGFRRAGLAFITPDHAKELAHVEIMPGDVLLNITGDSVARCCQVDESVLPARVNQHVAIIRPDLQKLDPRFLRYFLVSPDTQARMLSWGGSGGTRNALTKGMVESFEIFAPADLREQRAIAHILGVLDDKIELNRRMNETLEGIARAVFKSWFVDATQAGLPKGWREGKVEELLALSRETITPSDFPDETFDHYSIPSFDEGRLPKAETGKQIQSNKFLVPPGAVMISKLNPRIPRVWLPNVSAKQRSVASTEFLVGIPKASISREWLYALFSSGAFLDVFATLVTGTSGSHQRVKPEYLLAMDLEIPLQEHIAEYTSLTKSLHERFAEHLEESRTLAVLRDTLLPKLISGELLAEQAEKTAGTVA